MRNYAEGQVVEFHRAVKSVARNEWLEVVRAEDGKTIARNARDEEREFTAKHAKWFEVYERRPIEIAPNDKLLLMANRREPGFRATNGELVTVSCIDEQGRIHLQDGRTLPGNYKQFTHGYAVTAHRRRERDTRPGRGKFVICPVTLSEKLSGSRVEILTHGLEVSREVTSPLAQAVQRRVRAIALRPSDSGRNSRSVGRWRRA